VAAQAEDATAHRLLAAALRLGGEREAALASIDRAIALAPDEAYLHLERAGLLLSGRQLADAEAALARTTGLDPNQFPAYVLQAQLALGRGDLDEAERIVRTAARIAPAHPQVAAIEGMLALRRNDGERALSILTQASSRDPDEPQLRYALGFAYLAQGHLAFAEQAFRGVLERSPDNPGLRGLLADLLRHQGRPADAAAELAPLLADPARATPGLHRFAGELELAAGRPQPALAHLRNALAAQPQDRRSVLAAIEAWRQLGDADDARASLEALLAEHAELPHLWQARLAFEPLGDAAARTVVERWIAAMPAHLPALEALATLHAHAGDQAAAEAVAERILVLEPGHSGAELRLLSGLLARDPDAAVARVESLLAQATDPDTRRLLHSWLALAQDRAGRVDAAAAAWTAVQAEAAPQRLPLPTPSVPRSEWPELASAAPAPVALLWGLPGSGVERLAAVLERYQAALRADRFGARPPADALQNYTTPAALAAGELAPEALIAGWRAALPARGVANGQIIDWLLWWDNALLLALRPHLPEGLLLIALRDPRDMLLDWLAFGAPAPFALTSPYAAATWMAAVLNQVAALHEQDLYPHRLLRLDGQIDDAPALAASLSEALETPFPPLPPVPLGPPRLPPGRWRAYAEVLAEPFALLTPVARRLGYAES
jgi:predicted Zn-dependent protease